MLHPDVVKHYFCNELITNCKILLIFRLFCCRKKVKNSCLKCVSCAIFGLLLVLFYCFLCSYLCICLNLSQIFFIYFFAYFSGFIYCSGVLFQNISKKVLDIVYKLSIIVAYTFHFFKDLTMLTIKVTNDFHGTDTTIKAKQYKQDRYIVSARQRKAASARLCSAQGCQCTSTMHKTIVTSGSQDGDWLVVYGNDSINI